MENLTNEKIRAIVASRQPYTGPIIVVMWPTVGEKQYEVHFHLRWDAALQDFEADSAVVQGNDWEPADIQGMDVEQEEAFKEILFRTYGIRHVCFSPVSRRRAAVEKVLHGVTPLIRR